MEQLECIFGQFLNQKSKMPILSVDSDNRKVSSQNIKVHSKVVLHVHKDLF